MPAWATHRRQGKSMDVSQVIGENVKLLNFVDKWALLSLLITPLSRNNMAIQVLSMSHNKGFQL